ncbi:winged helix-turn-helix domain-containing protein [Arthrobacter dokdonensis]|uniref:winged helix-turn-helix domain-containing protein n=1 Tax=Arthrobacter dokdonellae TaxID=2211210 RepID=UPI000DE5C43D|nr:helix-turn-helix domain-containing protein [Arthrobacter dokdonellae]
MDKSEKIVDDLDTLKAIASPLRMKILGILRESGPATASELGRRLGESSGSTSYHLRQLERYGFVGDDEQHSRRERRWKALHAQTNFHAEKFRDDEAGRTLMESAVRYNVQYLLGNVEEYLRGDFASEWQGTFGVNDYLLRITAEDAAELLARMEELVESYRGRESSDPRAKPVAWHLLALPKKPS